MRRAAPRVFRLSSTVFRQAARQVIVKLMMDRHPLLWDYDISEAEFRDILAGRLRRGRLDQDWAVARLLEYGTYDLIRQLLGWADLVQGWPRWRHRMRSQSRRRGLDFLVEWLPLHHPELL